MLEIKKAYKLTLTYENFFKKLGIETDSLEIIPDQYWTSQKPLVLTKMKGNGPSSIVILKWLEACDD